MKKLIFCFDGTCNHPKDVDEPFSDISISNILKLHIFLGGKLSSNAEQNANTPNQKSLYYSGIGTRGNWFTRLINSAIAPVAGEMADILSAAFDDLKRWYQPGDEIFILGFSRGAAIARMFAAKLAYPVKFLGVFDTVAATKGSLDLNPETLPASGIVFENDKLAPHIEQALHLLSLDEERVWLQPTLFNADERVREVWFAGGHSDIGGGFWFDGLSDICLQFMLDHLSKNLTVLPIEKVDYTGLYLPHAVKVITYDDLVIRAEVTGLMHKLSLPFINNVIRHVRISEGEKPSEQLPILHHSVMQRSEQLKEYRPKTIEEKSYRILNAQGELVDFKTNGSLN